MGGKSQSAKKIVSLIPEHKCYCEIFFGGGSIFFEKKPSKVEVVNDINGHLMDFYRVIQRKPNEFLERGKYELYSRSLYYEYLTDFKIKKMHRDGKEIQEICEKLNVKSDYVFKIINTEFNDVEKAFRFFALIKEAFAAKFASGWGYGPARNVADAFFNEFKIVDAITSRLRHTQIDNRDFESVIDGYDSKDTLFVADPPYIKSIEENNNYYFLMIDTEFTLHDHQRLFNKLKSIKGKCIFTIDDVNWIRERYTRDNGFWIMENTVYYCSGDKDNRRHETELIITNYNPSSIQKHIDVNQAKLEF